MLTCKNELFNIFCVTALFLKVIRFTLYSFSDVFEFIQCEQKEGGWKCVNNVIENENIIRKPPFAAVTLAVFEMRFNAPV